MTKHPPSCDCNHCFVDDLNAVLRAFAEQREARQIDQHNAAAIHLAAEPWLPLNAPSRIYSAPTLHPTSGRLLRRWRQG